jgi:hypothetical protein
MDAPPLKGPSVSRSQRADSRPLRRLSIFPASRQLTTLSCETEFQRLMFRLRTIYLAAYRGFIGIRVRMGPQRNADGRRRRACHEQDSTMTKIDCLIEVARKLREARSSWGTKLGPSTALFHRHDPRPCLRLAGRALGDQGRQGQSREPHQSRCVNARRRRASGQKTTSADPTRARGSDLCDRRSLIARALANWRDSR